MNEIPALTIDFKKINAFTSERDLKLWKQQATAKCKYNSQILNFRLSVY